MRRYSSSGKIGSFLVGILGFFAVIFGIVLGVAGVKYVTENDIFGGGTSDTSIITTSDDTTSEQPTTSEDPITSEEPITSEVPVTSEPPVTSETPVSGRDQFLEMPVIDMISLDVWEGHNEAYFTSRGVSKTLYKTVNIPNFYNNVSIDFNSIKFESSTANALKFGFPSTVTNIHSNNDFRGSYTYVSYMVINGIFEYRADYEITKSINGSDGEQTDSFAVYVRTDNHLQWSPYASLSSFNQDAEYIQFALAYQTNNKSNNAMLTYASFNVSAPPLANEEGIYRIAVYNNDFYEETNFGDGWDVVNSTISGQLNMHYGISKSNYYYVDIKAKVDYSHQRYLALAIKGLVVGTFANIDVNELQPGVNELTITQTQSSVEGVWDFSYSIVGQRPFYQSDFN